MRTQHYYKKCLQMNFGRKIGVINFLDYFDDPLSPTDTEIQLFKLETGQDYLYYVHDYPEELLKENIADIYAGIGIKDLNGNFKGIDIFFNNNYLEVIRDGSND